MSDEPEPYMVNIWYTYETKEPKDIEQGVEEAAHNIRAELGRFLDDGTHLEKP